MADIRQQLYDRIKGSSKESVILEEMKRLGFWNTQAGIPSISEQLIAREADLTKELNVLVEQQRKFSNKEKALIEVRKVRLEKSKLKRAENKKIRKQKQEEKAARWKKQKEKDIIYLGDDVSKGLNNKETDAAKLDQHALPVLQSVEELAKAMETSVGMIRYLSYNRLVSKTTHYKRFYIPKKAGGKRLISTPMPKLKQAQYWILENILEKIPVRDQAHGFVKKRSIVTNALPHVKADVVVNIDMKDFFPTITYPRVKGLYQSLGYSEQMATILGLMCTEAECDQIELDGQTYYASGIDRFLPQGAPTSPAITNIICRKLDARLQGIAKKLNWQYTRYADDLTFSASGEATAHLKTLMGFIRKIVKDEKLIIHPDKVRVLRKGARKEVTGIVVNDRPTVNAKELDRFRALLFQIEKDGIAGKHWNNSPHLLASIRGYANFVSMVDPQKGKPLSERVAKILEKYQFKHVIKHKAKSQQQVKEQIVDQPAQEKKKPWWKFW